MSLIPAFSLIELLSLLRVLFPLPNYSGTQAFETFQHPTQVIQSVGLVLPKKDIWLDSISHVLVISTQSSIEIVGVSFEPSTSNPSILEMKLYPVDFSVKSQGVILYDICGSKDGRIFGRGSDQCLREVSYQSKEGWLTNKVSLLNHTNSGIGNYVPMILKSEVSNNPIDFITMDISRGVLYSLHGGKEIEVWHIPNSGPSGPNKIHRVKDICANATTLCRTAAVFLKPNEFSISWIGAVNNIESDNIHLVAVTTTGVRLYFSFYKYGVKYGTGSSIDDVPRTLDLIYVRPPPLTGSQGIEIGGRRSNQNNSETDFPNTHPNFHGVSSTKVFYDDGIFLAGAVNSLDPTGQSDLLLTVSRNPIPRSNSTNINYNSAVAVMNSNSNNGNSTGGIGGLTNGSEQADTATDLFIPGNIMAIAEIKNKSVGASRERLNPFATQILSPPRTFLTLTSDGLVVLTEKRPIDKLRELLETSDIFDQSVHHFFHT